MFSRPIFSVFGLRPTATSSFSASQNSPACRPWSVSVSFTPLPVFSMFSARAPVSTRIFCFLKIALQFLRDVLVLHRHDARQHLDHGDVRAEAVEDGGELHAHRARADDREALRHGGEIQDLDIGEDELGIGLQAGEHARLATRWR